LGRGRKRKEKKKSGTRKFLPSFMSPPYHRTSWASSAKGGRKGGEKKRGKKISDSSLLHHFFSISIKAAGIDTGRKEKAEGRGK